MECKKCNNPIQEGEMFCSICGARVEENAEAVAVETAEPVAAAQTPAAEVVTEEKPNKKGKKLLAAVIAVIVVLALGITAFASPVARNLIVKTFTSSETYFKHVAKNNLKDAIQDVTGAVTEYKTMALAQQASSGKISVELGQKAKDMIGQYGGAEATAYTNWLNNASIVFDSAVQDGNTSADLMLQVNGKDIVSLDVAVDDRAVYMTVPELSTTSLRQDIYQDMNEIYELMEQVLKVVPEEKVMDKLLNKYAALVIEAVDTVDEEREEIDAGELTIKATKLSAEIDGRTFVDAMEAVLESVEEDKEIENIVRSAAQIEAVDMDEDDLYEAFLDEVDYALDSLEDMDPGDEEVYLNMWVNNAGDIVGLGFELEDEVEASILSFEKGAKHGTSLVVDADGQKLEFVGGGETKGGLKSGEYTLEFSGMDLVTVKIADVNEAKLEDGLFEGELRIAPNSGIGNLLQGGDASVASLISRAELICKVTAPSKSDGTAEIILNVDGGTLATLRVEAALKDGGTVTIPTNSIDPNAYYAMDQWSREAMTNLPKLIDALEAAGLPADLANMMRMSLQMQMPGAAVTDADLALVAGEVPGTVQ